MKRSVAPVDLDRVKLHRNRGKWHVCPWCDCRFEGDPISGFCSGDCARAAADHRRHMEDMMDDWSCREMEHDDY